MRAVLLLGLLAAGFGLAAVWQRRHLDELRRQRQADEAVAAGELARTHSGELAPGAGVLLVGRPSGAEPVPRPARAARAAPSDPVLGPAPVGPHPDLALGDFSLEVQPGQSLSGIAYLHYGRSGPSLLRALAEYNALPDPDRLRAGQILKLPPLESLEQP